MPKRHILLVDDKQIVLESLNLLVEDIGESAQIAHAGRDALEKLETKRFDVVITDYEMRS